MTNGIVICIGSIYNKHIYVPGISSTLTRPNPYFGFLGLGKSYEVRVASHPKVYGLTLHTRMGGMGLYRVQTVYEQSFLMEDDDPEDDWDIKGYPGQYYVRYETSGSFSVHFRNDDLDREFNIWREANGLFPIDFWD